MFGYKSSLEMAKKCIINNVIILLKKVRHLLLQFIKTEKFAKKH